jgi:hypothetical protein
MEIQNAAPVGQRGERECESGCTANAIAQLATLTPLEYDRCRKANADALGLRVETLDLHSAHRERN